MLDFVAARALGSPEAMLPVGFYPLFAARKLSDPRKIWPSGFLMVFRPGRRTYVRGYETAMANAHAGVGHSKSDFREIFVVSSWMQGKRASQLSRHGAAR